MNYSVLTSPLFEFILGPEKSSIYVHSHVITVASRQLGALINASLSETTTWSMTLEDTDRETFILVCEYAYTGNYQLATPKGIHESYMTNGCQYSLHPVKANLRMIH